MFVRRLAIACLVVAVIAGVGIVAGNSVAQKKFQGTRSVNVPNLIKVDPGQPANYLLIGSDTRQLGDPEFANSGVEGQRADVMMVLHVEPATATGMLVSFPRDTLVQIPGHGRDLLNAAFSDGGPNLAVETLEANFPPLKINHYIEINFEGFKDIVNAIGHIPLWFPTPVHDPQVGLNIDKAGCVEADGATALAYARSRDYFIPKNLQNPAVWHWNYARDFPKNRSRGGDGWVTTGSDLDRIPRQQYFLRTISEYALSKTASDPTKLISLLDAVKGNFTRDDTLKFDELKALIRTFRGLKPSKVEMLTLPVIGITSGKDAGRVVATDAAVTVADRLMDFGKTSSPPLPKPLPPAQVSVRIVNGSGISGEAQKVADAFTAAGFHVIGTPADADRSDYEQTQIRYAPGKYAEAVTIAPAVGTLNLVPAISRQNTLNADVLVIVGRDYDNLKHGYASITTGVTAPTSAPRSTSTTAATSTTTTTLPATTVNTLFVPVDKDGGPLVGCPS